MNCSMPGFPVLHYLLSLLRLISVELVMLSNHLIFYHLLLLLPSVFPSLRVFSSESVLRISWPKYGSFNFSISPSSEYSGLISFRMNWFDLAVQGTLKSLFRPVWKHKFFSAQPSLWSNSHLRMTTGKTIALTRWTFVSKVMPLLFNMLSIFIIAFFLQGANIFCLFCFF